MARRKKGLGCVYRPTVTRVVRGKRQTRITRFYWAKYVDAQGRARRHRLRLPSGQPVTDGEVAETLLRGLLKRSQREAAGLIDNQVEAAQLPMRVVLARYVRAIRQRRRSRTYIRQVLQVGKFFINDGGITRLAEFTTERVSKALGKLADRGRSPKTVNEYRAIAYGLGEWLLTTAELTERNPVARVKRTEARGDIRRQRRALTFDEASRLLAAAPESRRTFYTLALYSGLRAGEIAALEWRDIELSGTRPVIRLRAETTKAGRADELPIHPALCKALASAKPSGAAPTDKVIPTVPTRRTMCGGNQAKSRGAKFTPGDLQRAGIPVADDRGRTLDRHALRTTFASWLMAVGVDERARMRLTRHSPSGVTMKHYTDFKLLDLWAEIGKLPDVIPPKPVPVAEPEELAATGTHGKSDKAAKRPRSRRACEKLPDPVGLGVGLITESNRVKRFQTVPMPNNSRGGGKARKAYENRGFRAKKALEPTGLEPVPSWLQTRRSTPQKPCFRGKKRGSAKSVGPEVGLIPRKLAQKAALADVLGTAGDGE